LRPLPTTATSDENAQMTEDIRLAVSKAIQKHFQQSNKIKIVVNSQSARADEALH